MAVCNEVSRDNVRQMIPTSIHLGLRSENVASTTLPWIVLSAATPNLNQQLFGEGASEDLLLRDCSVRHGKFTFILV